MGIGARIRDWVDDQAEEWGDRFGTFFGSVLGSGAREAYEETPEEVRAAIMTAIKYILDKKHSPTLRDILEAEIDLATVGHNPGITVTSGQVTENIEALKLITVIGEIVGSPLGLLPVIGDIYAAGSGKLYQNVARQVFEPERLDPLSYIKAEFRGAMDPDKIKRDMADLGFSKERQNAWREISRPLLSAELVRLLTLRFPDNFEEYRKELEKTGYTPEQIEAFEKLHAEVPPLADMVRFADFGSFDPEIIAAWRDFYDAPGWISEPFKLLGIRNEGDRDWANKYWFSHWRQPGRFELGEMHRRGLLGGRPEGSTRPETPQERAAADDIVRRAYLTQGFSSFWQGRLLDLVGENLTRVDIRRMHRIDVLNDEELSDAYHRLGYYGANNDHLVEFTKRYNATDDRDLTATEILKAYKRKTIDRDTALELLGEIGYAEAEADFKITAEDAGAADTERSLTEAKIKALYLTKIMPKLEATGELEAKGYDAQEIEYLYQLWDLEAIPDIKLPTRSELFHFLTEDIITEAEFTDWMVAIGYPEKHIGWYLQEHAADELADSRKEEERARQAADRVNRAAVKTVYEENRARIDVRVAVIRTYIAEKRLALLQAIEDEIKATIKEDIAAARVEIALLTEEKAGLKL